MDKENEAKTDSTSSLHAVWPAEYLTVNVPNWSSG